VERTLRFISVLASTRNGAKGRRQPPPIALGVRASDWLDRGDPCAFWSGVACCAGRVVELRLSGLRRTRAGARRAAFAVDQHQLRRVTALEAFNALVFPLPGRISSWFGRGLSPSSTSAPQASMASS
jgi:hypothetical protein